MNATDGGLVQKLYSPSSAAMAKGLPDIGEALAAALAELGRNPSPERCDQMAMKLTAAGHAVSRLRAQLVAESSL